MIGKFPVFALNFYIPPEYIDVNVHPAKLEVRFRDNDAVYDFIYTAVLEIFKDKVLIPNADWDSKNSNEVTELKKDELPNETNDILKNIDLSNFNTSKVTNMGDMFEGCGQLTELDLSSFDTSNVKIMYYMFNRDKGLKTIYVSDKWNISNVTESAGMFANCTSLTGTVPFDSTKIDASMANYTTGYLTYKKNTN